MYVIVYFADFPIFPQVASFSLIIISLGTNALKSQSE